MNRSDIMAQRAALVEEAIALAKAGKRTEAQQANAVLRDFDRQWSISRFEYALGTRRQFWCAKYFYDGLVVLVTEHDIFLDGVRVIYETGPLGDSDYRMAEAARGVHQIALAALESSSPSRQGSSK